MIEKDFLEVVQNIKNEMAIHFEDINLLEIEYGVKFLVTDQDYKMETVTLYNSGERLNMVYNLKNKQLSNLLPQILARYQTVLTVSKGNYIGIDESGKGDYFGPLVVAGFVGNEKTDFELLEMGVKDCKLLSDENVLRLSERLLMQYPSRCTIVPNEPAQYNKDFTQLKLVGKNMTGIIAYSQKEIISRLVDRHPDVTCILADMISGDIFQEENRIVSSIKIPFKQAIHAERNPSVAAAGILARANFLQWLKNNSDLYHVQLHKGADSKVIYAAAEYIDLYGKVELKKIAKIHFKTTQKVMAYCNSRM